MLMDTAFPEQKGKPVLPKGCLLMTLALAAFALALGTSCSRKSDSVSSSGQAAALQSGSSASAATSVNEPKTDIIVFAAASLRETMTAIKENYEKSNNVNIIYSFDSSGTLRTQLIAGADCDIFISAAQKQMDDITIGKNPNGVDLADASTVFSYLENKVALAVTNSNPAKISGFQDLANRLKSRNGVFLAIGNSDVPVGAYTLRIFDFFKIKESDIASMLTYGSNVKEVTSQVIAGAVDCGIIYQTDAFSAGLKVVDTAAPEMCGQVIYPACILKGSKRRAAAEKFFNYLKTEDAMKEMRKVGFVSAF